MVVMKRMLVFLADTIMRAERDGSVSHGLFRLPAYVAGLKSKKINGKARPELENVCSKYY